ncbi:enoyl-(acyl carrier protein) reductase [Candidatus Arthromitus sp. SFB-mouse-Japan]|uniref:enoyl-ACP reductase FabI n=1 Tax=Candidatus Arthromitus sp. SFB-mouse TaxID=49118 RepID=UPI00021B80F1|nr:enoyl-ACP reductase FabI [Candidatus Arthromitus sp. SFB-mouse]EIA23951.1 Enoyl-[acyl-carrier-protein] reductase (NADH) [Candidatus Arthromitus sp. SFB-3]EIA29362.1 Enoyl-[acyl-carrier-protein] reductase (NADH) [Candidatus Arthromitus sp. SFB-co]EIA30076.1 Enoyl-[acyl-carrier-protein] reductase (NADH) [Candidatus Arthromitus sp. SFB-mouse-SU]EGX28260.1 enoyl-[acyl-carrier-protein] reductase [Candidatus Arthromitus sp. SFB-mouse-NYU]BAK57059.1 enoyl-(acyl carrier protein) reductase [Candidat
MELNLNNKNIVIMGVANNFSIAWHIAKSLNNANSNIIFTYVNDRFRDNIEKLSKSLNDNYLIVECDVTDDESIRNCFKVISEKVGVIHGIVHSIAFANKNELKGEYLNTTRDGFLLAQNVSSYSLTGVIKEAEQYMTEGGSIVTLTYYGSEKVVPNYNVMGVAKASLDMSVKYLANDLGRKNIRVNAISAGPIKTLSAKGVSDFNLILDEIEKQSPLRRLTDPSEVGDTALFLMSDLSRGITGEIIHVDSGFNILGGRNTI